MNLNLTFKPWRQSCTWSNPLGPAVADLVPGLIFAFPFGLAFACVSLRTLLTKAGQFLPFGSPSLSLGHTLVRSAGGPGRCAIAIGGLGEPCAPLANQAATGWRTCSFQNRSSRAKALKHAVQGSSSVNSRGGVPQLQCPEQWLFLFSLTSMPWPERSNPKP